MDLDTLLSMSVEEYQLRVDAHLLLKREEEDLKGEIIDVLLLKAAQMLSLIVLPLMQIKGAFIKPGREDEEHLESVRKSLHLNKKEREAYTKERMKEKMTPQMKARLAKQELQEILMKKNKNKKGGGK